MTRMIWLFSYFRVVHVVFIPKHGVQITHFLDVLRISMSLLLFLLVSFFIFRRTVSDIIIRFAADRLERYYKWFVFLFILNSNIDQILFIYETNIQLRDLS